MFAVWLEWLFQFQLTLEVESEKADRFIEPLPLEKNLQDDRDQPLLKHHHTN